MEGHPKTNRLLVPAFFSVGRPSSVEVTEHKHLWVFQSDLVPSKSGLPELCRYHAWMRNPMESFDIEQAWEALCNKPSNISELVSAQAHLCSIQFRGWPINIYLPPDLQAQQPSFPVVFYTTPDRVKEFRSLDLEYYPH